MIKIENGVVGGLEAAVRGMRNPMNSWEKSDSKWDYPKDDKRAVIPEEGLLFYIGPNDLDLMKRLVKAGPDHSKFMRMIGVSLDIVAPLYWWKEFDTYKVGTVANSCSTMHKIHDKPFTLDDFSTEHLSEEKEVMMYDEEPWSSAEVLYMTIGLMNYYRKKFIETKNKACWWQMIQLLPTSYNQRRTVSLNYAVLANMYKARKAHKLDEWREFCKWIESLPYSELITGEWEK